MGTLLLWLCLFYGFHAWIWPFYGRSGGWSILWDGVLAALVTYYIRLHLRRRTLYGNSRKKWGVVREDEFARIQQNVGYFLERERAANCAECRGTGRQGPEGLCPACKGNGYRKGKVKRPFLVPYPGRNEVFIGWNALEATPVFLTGEERFQTTNIYGIQGTGKTRRIGNLVNRQLLFDDKASLVYFSLKKEDAASLKRQALEAGWQVHLMQGVSLLQAFGNWSQLEQAFRLGMTAAGYQSRESFWFDRAMQLLKDAGGAMGPVLRSCCLE